MGTSRQRIAVHLLALVLFCAAVASSIPSGLFEEIVQLSPGMNCNFTMQGRQGSFCSEAPLMKSFLGEEKPDVTELLHNW